ncbi:hypothetical protein E4T44_01170 [Aureobasidium sp. EXF-8845]|nr:hypothetical protein E4T44_01170 [Aureobasidium sp. EXF-8845]KAI4857373.1 hypothetical protein E4T45_01135 [Aureobasidium sp. EXF-8846]
MISTSPTRILVISDTHGANPIDAELEPVDLVIHCGDLTQESKLDEYKQVISLLKSLDAPLKLVIAGNHDFTLDTPVYKQKLTEAGLEPPHEDEVVMGEFGETRALLESERDAGILFLDEGTHEILLANDQGVDIVITHGPPEGILDRPANKERAGCPDLFAAIANARPFMHCFGHIHESWGAKKVTWRGTEASETPSHFTDIDNDNSELIESLATLRSGRFDSSEETTVKQQKSLELGKKGYSYTAPKLVNGLQTLFVNAAIEGGFEETQRLPWLVEVDLPIPSNCTEYSDQQL